jgi:hypothetical protein
MSMPILEIPLWQAVVDWARLGDTEIRVMKIKFTINGKWNAIFFR